MSSLLTRTGSAVARVIPADETGLLHRVRSQFVLLASAASIVALLDLGLGRIDTVQDESVYLAVVAAFLSWVLILYRYGERWLWLDVLGPALIAALGIAAGDYSWAFAALYGAIFIHGTFGSARRTAVIAVLYVAAYELAVAETVGVDEVVESVVSHAISVFVVAYLVRAVTASVRRHDANRRRERILTRGGAELLLAGDADEVARTALQAVVEIVDPVGAHRASLWRLQGDDLKMTALNGRVASVSEVSLAEMPDGLVARFLTKEVLVLGPAEMRTIQRGLGIPEDFRHGVSFPLVEAEELTGLVFVATETPIDDDTVAALERFMFEVSLADVLVRRQAILRGVVDNSADAILMVGRDSTIRFASPAVSRLTGADPTTLVGRPIGDLVFRRTDTGLVGLSDLAMAAESGQELLAGVGDRARQVELSVGALAGDGLVVNLRDITERRRLEEEITYRAFHDPVTGLANRALFNDRLAHALARADRDGKRLAVALIDLDDFKAVNDVHGHSAGDGLLVATAERLSGVLRRGDTPARFGGDEFAVLMENIRDEQEVDAVLTRIVEAIRQPFAVGSKTVAVSASVGVRVGQPSEPVETIIGDADVAMYVAKAKGKNQLVRFEDDMRLAALARLELKSELQNAIETDQLVLHYQPIVSIETGRVSAFEALVRWDHPERGMISPDDFIPAAESTGLIVPLGRWVLRKACRQLADWLADGLVAEDTRMSVNLSAHQLLAADLIPDIVGILERTGLKPGQLGLEVTETALMDEPERAGEVLSELAVIGIEIAIDDFGTGYSSFAYLQRFPVDVIKIDRSFITHIAEGPEQAALAHAIVKLAQTLRMETIAEGVEEADQVEVLAGWGCTHGQGWHWSKAMPAEDVADWVASRALAEGSVPVAPS